MSDETYIIKTEKKEIRFTVPAQSLCVVNKGDSKISVTVGRELIPVPAGAQFIVTVCNLENIFIECKEDSIVQVGHWPHPQTKWIITEMDEVAVARAREKLAQEVNSEDEVALRYVLTAKVTREKLAPIMETPEEETKLPLLARLKKKLTKKI